MRFVLPSLVDAHLPAPASPPRAPRPHTPGSTRHCKPQPDPKSPSLTTNPRSIRCFTYCAAISGFSPLNPAPNPRKRSTQPHTPTSNRAHPPVGISLRPPALQSSVLRYLDFRPGLGPDLRDIAAQYLSDNRNPESPERDVVHPQVRCPTPQGCVLRYCLFWPQIHLLAGDIAAHIPGLPASRRVWVSTVLRYLDFGPRIRALIPQNAAHNSRREGRTWERAALNREGVDKQCETGPAHTGTQLHF